jgi:hypothetical protein
MSFDRNALPDWITYADREGLTLTGRGPWRTVPCDFHDDQSPSMRVNISSGGWCCMACGAKGGDTLAHHMQRSGLSFIASARALGAWRDDGRPVAAVDKPRALSARDALAVIANSLPLVFFVISDARRGLLPNDETWQLWLRAVGRLEWLATEYRS